MLLPSTHKAESGRSAGAQTELGEGGPSQEFNLGPLRKRYSLSVGMAKLWVITNLLVTILL